MRRHDKEITDRLQLDAIIHASQVCHLAMAKDNEPYLVPLSFGYDGRSLYFHTAMEGRKIDFFEANPNVCFSFVSRAELRRDEHTACKWSFNYESVTGYGIVRELTEPAQKEFALNEVMRHYSGKTWTFEDSVMSRTRAWKIEIISMTAKHSHPKAD